MIIYPHHYLAIYIWAFLAYPILNRACPAAPAVMFVVNPSKVQPCLLPTLHIYVPFANL